MSETKRNQILDIEPRELSLYELEAIAGGIAQEAPAKKGGPAQEEGEKGLSGEAKRKK